MIKNSFIKIAAIVAVSALTSAANAASYSYTGIISSIESPFKDFLETLFLPGLSVGTDLLLTVDVDGKGDVNSAMMIYDPLGTGGIDCLSSDMTGVNVSVACSNNGRSNKVPILAGGQVGWSGAFGSHYDNVGGYTGPFQQLGSTVQDLGTELDGELLLRGTKAFNAWDLNKPLSMDMYFTFVEGGTSSARIDINFSILSNAVVLIIDDLTLSPVPVPAAVWLFGSALLGLAGVGRTRKAV